MKYDLSNITPEGSLGLLAAGHTGLIMWRMKRREFMRQKLTEKNISQKGKGNGRRSKKAGQ